MVVATAAITESLPPARVGLTEAFEGAYGADLIGVTYARIRGRIWVAVPPTTTNQVRIGMKVNDNRTPADAAESLYNPLPVGGAHDDWMGFYVLAAGPPAAEIAPEMSYVDVDVKSARKGEELGERLEIYFSSISAVGDPGDTVLAFDLSVLLMLP